MTNDNHSKSEPAAFSLKEFCQRYGVGLTSAHEAIKSGKLRTVRLGTKHLVPKESADAWLASLPPSVAAA